MRFLFKTRYTQDIRLFKHGGQVFWYGLLGLALLAVPWLLSDYIVSQLSFIFIYAIVCLGLGLLIGYTGQVSLGHAAFLGIGAYTHAILLGKGVPFIVSMPIAAVVTGLIGLMVGLPALRVRGMYLAIATLAFGFIVEEVVTRAESLTGGNAGKMVPNINLFGFIANTERSFYYIALVITVLCVLGVMNLLRSRTGRAFVAIRDSEVSAQSMGINLARYKTIAFALSAALTGIGGVLYAHKVRFISPEHFTLLQSVELLIMLVIGGLGSVYGAIMGSVFWIVVQQFIASAKDFLPQAMGQQVGLQATVFGLLLVAFVLFEPLGLYGRWVKIRTYLELFPFYRKDMFKRQKTYMKSERMK